MTRMMRMVADLFETRSAKIPSIRVIRVLFQPLLIFIVYDTQKPMRIVMPTLPGPMAGFSDRFDLFPW